jgi:hypothetical protein
MRWRRLRRGCLPRPKVLFQQGSVYFLGRKFEKLEAAGHELVALEPNWASGHRLLGLYLEQGGQVAKASFWRRRGLIAMGRSRSFRMISGWIR